MIEKVYEQLRTPKTIEELHQRLHEVGIMWNKYQVELFLQMDKNIVKKEGTYSVSVKDNKETILDIIDKTLGAKPMIPIKKVMDNIPEDMVVGADEILRIAIESGKYQSPNGAVLKKVN